MDMISNLPDDILRNIVTFLSAKEAALASIVSKKWWNLITIIQDAEFDDAFESEGSLTDFLDEVLAQPLDFRVWTFTLKCKGVDPTHFAKVNHTICNVLKRGVIDLQLEINAENGYYPLPFEVFTCKTVVKLDLGIPFKIEHLPTNAYLPRLKTIVVEVFKTGDAFDNLLSACPMLFHVELRGMGARFVVPYRKIEICKSQFYAYLREHHYM